MVTVLRLELNLYKSITQPSSIILCYSPSVECPHTTGPTLHRIGHLVRNEYKKQRNKSKTITSEEHVFYPLSLDCDVV